MGGGGYLRGDVRTNLTSLFLFLVSADFFFFIIFNVNEGDVLLELVLVLQLVIRNWDAQLMCRTTI